MIYWADVLYDNPETGEMFESVADYGFVRSDKSRLANLSKDILLHKTARVLPTADGERRIYVIGHPKGGTLQFSLPDNILLDHEDPRIHYRTPTEGGNSGSPIFNQQWDLIGIHHGSDLRLKRLNGKEGRMKRIRECG